MKSIRSLIVICVLGLFVAGCGPADQQQVEQILSGVAQTTVAGVTIVPETPVATLDVNVVVKQTFAAMTQQAGGPQVAATPTAPAATQAAPASNATTGSISGNLNYPSSSIPAMYVTAYQVGTQNYQFVITNAGQNTFQINDLNPGTYNVIAYTVGGGGFPIGLPGGYTKAVLCGLSVNCTDHTLIDVTVEAGKTASDIKPFDWYAPQGSFMAFPQQGVGQPSSATVTPATTGGISGTLMYPAGGVGMPSLRIVAFQVGTSNYYHVDTALGQNTYQLDNLPPGKYRIVTYVLPGGAFTGGLSGGYTQSVPCGLQYGCNDHTLIDVVVTVGHVTTDINPNDYYAPAGTFPPDPIP